MKKLFILFVFMASALPVFCQDLIVDTKGDSLNCKIISEDESYFFVKITTQKGERINTLINKKEVFDVQYDFFTIQKQEKRITNRNKWRLGFDIGIAYRIAETSTFVDRNLINLVEGAKFGYTFGTDCAYFFSTYWGVGLRYNYFKSSNEELHGKIKFQTNYVSPSIYARVPFRSNPNNIFISSFGLGYMGENQSCTYNSQDIKLKGSTVGIMVSVGFDVKLSSSTALSIEFAFLGGSLGEATITRDGTTQKQTLSDDQRERLSRIEFKLGLKFLP